MSEVREPRIVVGVSGSPASAMALRWAAREAARRHTQLHVVLAWQAEQRAYYAGWPGSEDHGRRQQAAELKLAGALRAVLGADLPGSLQAEVIEGLAERTLVQESDGAELLVLGSTSAPTLAGRSIGPVIRSCLSRAHCPVVVVGPEGLAEDCPAPMAGRMAAALS